MYVCMNEKTVINPIVFKHEKTICSNDVFIIVYDNMPMFERPFIFKTILYCRLEKTKLESYYFYLEFKKKFFKSK